MILAVSGWRGWSDVAFVVNQVHRYQVKFGNSLHIRVGDADGLDKIIRKWCEARNFDHTVYYADWVKYGRPAAGPIRNAEMLQGDNPQDPYQGQLAHKLLAFPQPGVKMRSPGSGTVGCLIEANFLGISVDIPGYRAPGTK